jgi:hypothetical protein
MSIGGDGAFRFLIRVGTVDLFAESVQAAPRE